MKAKELAALLMQSPELEVMGYDANFDDYYTVTVKVERQGLFNLSNAKGMMRINGIVWGDVEDGSMRLAYGEPLQERIIVVIS